MLDVGNLRRRVETRESFITDETNLMEKKKEREREEGKEGKRMDEKKEKKEKYRYTRTYTSIWKRVESSFVLVSPKGEGISRATGLREEPLCI